MEPGQCPTPYGGGTGDPTAARTRLSTPVTLEPREDFLLQLPEGLLSLTQLLPRGTRLPSKSAAGHV